MPRIADVWVYAECGIYSLVVGAATKWRLGVSGWKISIVHVL